MAAEFIKLYEENPQRTKIEHIVDVLKKGGVIIYTIYGIGCDLFNRKAIDRVRRIKGIKPKKFNLSFICNDISQVAEYVRRIDNQAFKVMKKSLPGPFTFIFEASSKVPKILETNKKTVGVRIPANNIPRDIVEVLGNPLVTSSIKAEDEVIEYTTDPELIYDELKNEIDLFIDGGYGGNIPSTVIDLSQGGFEVIREGLVDIYEYI